jgi:hypothetical protein
MNDRATIVRKLRARRIAVTAFLIAFATGFFVAGTSTFLQKYFPTAVMIGTVVVFFVCFSVVLGSMVYQLIAWRCPKCGKAFAFTWLYHNAFAMKCLHCGVKLDGSNIDEGLTTEPHGTPLPRRR